MCSNCSTGRTHAQIMDYQGFEIKPKREQLVKKHFPWLMSETRGLQGDF